MIDPKLINEMAKMPENERKQIAKALDDAALKEALDPKNAETQKAAWDKRTRRLKGRYD